MPEVNQKAEISIQLIIIFFSVLILVFAILFFFFNPDTLEKKWFWIIGLIGSIIAFFNKITSRISNVFDINKKDDSTELRKANIWGTVNFCKKISSSKLIHTTIYQSTYLL